MKKLMKIALLLLLAATGLSLGSCSSEPQTVDYWKWWVINKSNYCRTTNGSKWQKDFIETYLNKWKDDPQFNFKYYDKFCEWWIENYMSEEEWWWDNEVPKHIKGIDDLKNELLSEKEQFEIIYYSCAYTAISNTLYEAESSDDIEKILERDWNHFLNRGFPLRNKLEMMNIKPWAWTYSHIENLYKSFPDEFYKNVMLILSDANKELNDFVEKNVIVYSCEYDADQSTSKADVYEVIYCINNDLYVKCYILETSDGNAEIQMVDKSEHLLDL